MKKILILGDSHSLCFKKKNPHYHTDLVFVKGASVQGLTNPNSKLNALNTFKTAISKYKTHDHVLLYFGEVDCNATIWIYKEKYNATLKEQFFRSINNYKTFIEKQIEPYFDKTQITILGPILPTIKTKNNNSQNSRMRRQVNVTQSTRTRLTNIFNQHLLNLGYNFISINDLLVDKNTGLIKEAYANEFNHHINRNIAYELWMKKLPSIIPIK
jgi:hypothetical protein